MITALLLVALVISPALAAQSGSSGPAAVSIQLSETRTSGGGVDTGLDGVRIRNLSLLYLVMNAYDLQDFQVTGIPAAMVGVKYDIELKNVPDWKQALQKVLADRFKLAFHRETRRESGYDLVVVTGAALAAAGPGACQATAEKPCRGFNADPTSITGQRVSMDQLSTRLTRSLGRTVTNKTGLQGVFDVALRWTGNQTSLSPADVTASTSGGTGPNIFAALEQQLGLKLVPVTTGIEILKIDHAEAPALN